MNIDAIRRRMLDIAKQRGLTHLGSCCSVLPILYKIYESMAIDDVVVLSNGHAGLALYCILEAFRGCDAESLCERMGTHPERDEKIGIYCSTGSLGCGLAVAVGYALAGRRTHVVISDGECAEGIVWECLAFISDHPNLPISVHVNANGWGAYRKIDDFRLEQRLRSFFSEIRFHRTRNEPFPDDLRAHYMKVEE